MNEEHARNLYLGQPKLRRGMVTRSGHVVLHGEVGNMPRQNAQEVTLVDTWGELLVLRWRAVSERWHIPHGDEFPEDSIVTPDLDNDGTRMAVVLDMKERICGERVEHPQMFQDEELSLVAKATAQQGLHKLTPKQQQSENQQVISSVLGAMFAHAITPTD